MKQRLTKIMQLAGLAAATTFGLAGQTHAALYQGTWDPAFGGPFPELGWRATANLYIAEDCRAGLAAGHNYAGGPFTRFWNPEAFAYAPCVLARESSSEYLEAYGAATVELRDVRVDFYDLGTDAVLASIFPDTYKFPTYCEIYDCRTPYGDYTGPGPVNYGTGAFLLGLEVDANGVPVYFDTSDSTRSALVFPGEEGDGEAGFFRALTQSVSSATCGSDPLSGYSFSAKLGSLGTSQEIGLPGRSGLNYFCNTDAAIFGSSTFKPELVVTTTVDGVVTPIIINGVPVAANLVPEPGTFALAGLALMLAAAARRSRRV